MAAEMVEKKPAKPRQTGGVTLPQVDHDPLPCPRCESINTKFCYYNNYNFSQPRHFCKACRRYWTQGGTLRDIPIGGGTRKTAKRCRTSSSSLSSTSTPTSVFGSGSGSGLMLDSLPASQVFVSLPSSGPNVVTEGTPVSLAAVGGATFSSLLSNAGSGILGLSGFGLGLGLDEVGFGLQRGGWPFSEVGYVNGGDGAGINGFASGGISENGNMNRGDTWQSENVENGLDVNGGDCFSSLPVLAISTPGNAMK